MKLEHVFEFILILALATLIVVGVIIVLHPASPYGTTTATFPEETRLTYWDGPAPEKAVPGLNCSSVKQCGGRGLTPDTYTLEDGNQLFIWKYKYTTQGIQRTVLYIVENRASQPSWDMIGLEHDSDWKIGIYAQSRALFTQPWKKIALNKEFPVAIGLQSEEWAVIVMPTDEDHFNYLVVEKFW